MSNKIYINAQSEGAFILNENEEYRISSMGRIDDPNGDAIPDSPNFINNIQIDEQGELEGKRLYRVKITMTQELLSKYIKQLND